MAFREKDYIKRMIQRLAEAVAALAGAKARGDHEAQRRIVEDAGDDLFPGRLGALDAVEAAGVAFLLERSEERRAYASLCRLRAEVAADGGRAAEATSWRTRAEVVEAIG